MRRFECPQPIKPCLICEARERGHLAQIMNQQTSVDFHRFTSQFYMSSTSNKRHRRKCSATEKIASRRRVACIGATFEKIQSLTTVAGAE